MERSSKVVNGCNHSCNISFWQLLLYEINIKNFSNTGATFTPEVYIIWEKDMVATFIYSL